MGELAKRNQLGELKFAVLDELGEVTIRPVEENGKEMEAVDTAIYALAEFGTDKVIPYLKTILFSKDEFF